MNHFKSLREKAKHMAKTVLSPLTLLFAQFGKTGKLLSTGKRQITASILSIAMVFTMVPALSLTAFAAAPTPLTFTAQKADSSVTFSYKSGSDVQYNKNNGGWTACPSGTSITLTNINDAVSFRGTNVVTDSTNHFAMTGTIAASGDVTSLTNEVGGDVALTNSCYWRMFDSCESLTTAPALPSTTLDGYCYYAMFACCSGLIEAPVLPANTLKNNCYQEMFKMCENLPTAPALPATELADYCYSGMFYGCYNLTTVPALPATTLKVSCYDEMFSNCGSLKISNTETGVYTKEWRIPTTGTISTTAERWNHYMLDGTGGTFTGDPAENTIYYIAEPNYLTFTAQADDSSVTLAYESGDNVEYKKNDGEWTACPSGTSITLSKAGDTVSFRGVKVRTDDTNNHFFMTGKLAASGDVTSLTNFSGGNAGLDNNCYIGMFSGCTGLTAAPALPATVLAMSCYNSMFQGCTGLTTAPALPATKLAPYCYDSMFQDCTGLTAAPELPATELPESCYSCMFNGCTGLKISTTETGAYTKAWRIPTTGDATSPGSSWNRSMLSYTTGTFKNDPELNTTYYLYEDLASPVISGIEDGKTYCITADFTITDADLATVTANGTALTAAEGTYTLTEVGTYDVVATDVAGNSRTITVTLNADHTWDGGVITKAPTAAEKGEKTYTCTACGETKTEEIAKLAPTIIDGNNGSYQQGGKDGQTFKSNASFADFVSVSVDGKVIDKANYTLKEGSTIVTLTTDYLATLSVGKHTLAINSTTGTASTEFTITAKAADSDEPEDSTKPDDLESPDTGETSNTALLLALLFLSGGALTTLAVSKEYKKGE